MTKQEFLLKLRKGLSGLPREDIYEWMSFYGEMIEDRIEDGLSEEEAVAAVGSVDEIIAHILADTPSVAVAKENKKGMSAWGIALLILGSPIWISLAVAAISVVLSLYVSLWAVFVSLIGGAVYFVASGIAMCCKGNMLAAVCVLAIAAVCAGLSIFAFYGCRSATLGTAKSTKKFAIWIKKRLVKREEEQ